MLRRCYPQQVPQALIQAPNSASTDVDRRGLRGYRRLVILPRAVGSPTRMSSWSSVHHTLMPKDILPLSLHPLVQTLRRIGLRGVSANPGRVALLAFRAPFLSFCHWSQNHSPPSAQSPLPDPFFILGYWRSGTTFLHELLSLDKRFVAPTTYQCFNPQTFLLARQTPANGSAVRRPMDAMTITPDSPQEDEFALLGLGAPSPYEYWLAPRGMATDFRYALCLDALPPAMRQHWQRTLLWFVRAFAGLAGGRRTPLLKSPPHSFRIPALLRLFPRARFVYLIREPDQVFASARRTFAHMLARYSLEPYQMEDLESYLVNTRLLLEERIQIDAQPLCARGCFCTIRFADLIRDPEAVIEGLYAYHGFDLTPDFQSRLAAHFGTLSGYQPATRTDTMAIPSAIANLTEPSVPCLIH